MRIPMWTARLIPRIWTPEGFATVLVRDHRKRHPLSQFPGGRRGKKDLDWRSTIERENPEETGMHVTRESIVYVTEYEGSHGWPVLVGAADILPEELVHLDEPREDPEVPFLVLCKDVLLVPDLHFACEAILRNCDPFARLPTRAPACV